MSYSIGWFLLGIVILLIIFVAIAFPAVNILQGLALAAVVGIFGALTRH